MDLPSGGRERGPARGRQAACEVQWEKEDD